MKLKMKLVAPKVEPAFYVTLGVFWYQAFPELVGENIWWLAAILVAGSVFQFRISRANP